MIPDHHAATRDASWYDYPNTSSASHVPRYHAAKGASPACDRRALLDEDSAVPLDEVPAQMRCRRPACARRFAQ